MKKIITAASILLFIIIIGGCKTPPQLSESDKIINRSASDGLVVVYSLTGNTAKMAKTLSKELNSDYIRITDPERKSVNFITSPSRNKVVKYVPEKVNLSQYKVIFLGTPVWWMKPTAYIYSFIKNHDFTGKKIILFYTYRGWLFKSAQKEWKELVSKQGGEVIDVIGINCKTLDDKTVEAAAKEIILLKKNKWNFEDGIVR